MKAIWRLVSIAILLGIVTVAAAEGAEPSDRVATRARDSYDMLADELAALRSRIDELQRERPALDLHAFQNECNSSVYCSTKDGHFCANFGGRIELDSLWATGDQAVENAIGPLEDGIFFRRARLHAAGTLYNVIDYYAEFEFAPVDHIVFQDVWIQLRDVPWLGHIRAGHLKVPFGLENETSANT